jgi:hypothetical protein
MLSAYTTRDALNAFDMWLPWILNLIPGYEENLLLDLVWLSVCGLSWHRNIASSRMHARLKLSPVLSSSGSNYLRSSYQVSADHLCCRELNASLVCPLAAISLRVRNEAMLTPSQHACRVCKTHGICSSEEKNVQLALKFFYKWSVWILGNAVYTRCTWYLDTKVLYLKNHIDSRWLRRE